MAGTHHAIGPCDKGRELGEIAALGGNGRQSVFPCPMEHSFLCGRPAGLIERRGMSGEMLTAFASEFGGKPVLIKRELVARVT